MGYSNTPEQQPVCLYRPRDIRCSIKLFGWVRALLEKNNIMNTFKILVLGWKDLINILIFLALIYPLDSYGTLSSVSFEPFYLHRIEGW